MRLSWNWLQELTDLSSFESPQALADFLTFRGLEVEELHRQDQGLEKVVSVKILSRDPHPQADRLSLCKVTTGSGEPLEIVCGAQNMKAGDIVCLAQIGAHLPNGLKITQSKIRGVVSNGMLCSESELHLAAESQGILILPPSTPLGKPLASILNRNDAIFHLKLTANRGDCLSHWGIAREVASHTGKPLKTPKVEALDWKGTPIRIELEAGDLAPQFLGCVIEGAKVRPSPEWVKTKLEAMGSRSINSIVDATNLVMFEFGHPVHAYDLKRLEGGKIGVRLSHPGETVPLLDESEITCDGSELIIVDGKKAIGLAGVMGGGNTSVEDATTSLFLECAEFHPGRVRKASAKHVKKTDAAHRFERGIDPRGLERVMGRLAALILELSGGKVVSSGASYHSSRDPKTFQSPKIPVEPAYFNQFLGTDFSEAEIAASLESHACKVEKTASLWQVTPPSHRIDLRIREDLAEEVARSLGYDRIPNTVPPLTGKPQLFAEDPHAQSSAAMDEVKDVLAAQGLNEVVNLGFAASGWLKQFGFTNPLKVVNPLSEDHDCLVPSLLPGLIQNALHNWHHSFGSEMLPIRLFELRPVFSSTEPIRADGEMKTTAVETRKLAIALAGPRFASGLRSDLGEVDFYDLQAQVEGLIATMGMKGVRLIPLHQSRTGGNSMFHPGQSVEVLAGNRSAGHFGLLHPGLARKLKIKEKLWLAELDWSALAGLARAPTESRQFTPWNPFPAMERDFALLVKDDVQAEKVTQLAIKSGKPLAKVAKIFDTYRGKPVPEGMLSIAVRVVFYDETRSLQESETEAASQQILEAWKKDLGAQLR